MKKIIILLLSSILFVTSMFMFASCNLNDVDISKEPDDITYELNSSEFPKTVAYGEELDLSKLYINKTQNGTTTAIPVEKSMITSGDTNSVGTTNLVISYEDQTFNVQIYVKYLVEFKNGDEILSSQLVIDSSEIVVPNMSSDESKTFKGWSERIPGTLSGNLSLSAIYELNIPSIGETPAYYGDTLADIELPSNINGKWEFVLDGSTSVGKTNTENEFEVRFVSPEGEVLKTSTLTLWVDKKVVTFTNTKIEFVYNGKRQIPTFDTDYFVSVIFIEDVNYNYTDAGVYSFAFEVDDENYQGSFVGEYVISKAPVKVVIDSYTIISSEQIPEIKYTIEGLDDADLLGLTINKPTVNGAGTYYITATASNPNVNLTVEEGTLTVTSATLSVEDVGAPTPSREYATFGDKISSITLGENPNGVWAWENPYSTVGNAGINEHYAVFTPYDTRYEEIRYPVTILVNKKVVYISTNTVYGVYNGNLHEVNSFIITENEDGTGREYDLADYVNIKYKLQNSTSSNDDEPRNAGMYDVTLTLAHDNYTAVATTEVIISKAIPDTIFSSAVLSATWSSSLTLEAIDLDAGYSWKNPDTRITSVGMQAYSATFVPADTVNYETVNGDFLINVAKATSSISGVSDSYTFAYNGSSQMITGIRANHEETEIGYSYSKNGNVCANMINAGTYTVTITVPESEHYLSTTATTTVVITPIANTETVNVNQSATYGNLLSSLALPEGVGGTWSWKDSDLTDTVGNAGTNKIVALFTPSNENYVSREVEVTVTISKKEIQIPTITQTFVYTGSLITSGLTSTGEYTVEDGGALNAGADGTVTITLKDTANYKWVGVSEDSVTLTYRIVSAVNEWTSVPSLSKNNWTYGDEAATFSAAAKFGTVLVEFKLASEDDSAYTSTVPTNAGSYVARFSTTDINATILTKTIEFTIAKKQIAVPTISNNSFVYTGEKFTSGIVSDVLYNVVDNGGTEVGGYNAVLTLADSNNYVWSNGETSTVRIAYSIVKPNIVISGLAIDNWTYGTEASNPTATKNNALGTIVYLYSSEVDGTYTQTQPTNAGTYYVKACVYGTNNYDTVETEPISFVINKADASITATGNYNFVYNGEAVSITGITASHSESALIIALDGSVDFEIINVGEYTITATLPESANYNEAVKNITVTVSAADNKETVVTSQNATYGNSISVLTLPAGVGGTWSWENSPSTVGNAGVNVLKAIFTPSNANYNAREVEVTVTVAKKNVSLPIVSDKEYTGSQITSGLVDADLYTVTEDNGGSELGNYKVILALKDSSNYKWETTEEASVEITYTIAAAVNSWVTDPSITPSWEYGQTGTVLAEAKYGEVKVEYKLVGTDVYTTTLPTAAGNYIARFTTTDANYTILTVERSFAITKKVIEIPTLNQDTFVYTGNKFTSGITSTDNYEVSDSGITNAGECKVTITLSNENYIWNDNTSAAIEYTYYVVKANSNLAVSILGWVYNDSAKAPEYTADFEISGVYFLYAGADGIYSETVPTNAGTYTVKAVYEGNENIEAAEATATFVIDKIDASISGYENSYTSIYNGNAFEIPNLTASHSESEFEFSYVKDGVAATEIKNVGEYTVTITLPESTNYNSAEVTVTVTINKVTNTDEIPSYNSVFGNKLSSIALPTNENGIWSWVNSEALVGNVGVNTHKAVFTPNDTVNYEGREVDVTVNVSKKTVTIPTALNSVYTGNVITSGISTTDIYTVVDNGGINIGSYVAKLTLVDSANYAWAGTDATSVEVEYEIAKATNEWTTSPSITPSWKYGETGDAGSATPKVEGLLIEYKLDGADDSTYNTTLPTTAGKYIARFTTTNPNYTTLSVTLGFEITKIQVEIPSASDHVYTGEQYTSGIVSNEYYDVNDVGGVNAGVYSVIATLKDPVNYGWNDGSADASKTISYNINKADAVISNVNVKGEWKYGVFEASTADTNFGTVEFTYSSSRNGEFTSDYKSLSAGTAYIKISVAGTENYNGDEIIREFLIEKAAPTSITVPDTLYSGTYYENKLPSMETIVVKAKWYGETITLDGTFAYTDITFAEGEGNSSATIVFTPTNKSYTTIETTVTLSLYTVATINQTTAFGTIENAVEAAVSGDIVWVHANSQHGGETVYITRNFTVNSGVTLLLPYLLDGTLTRNDSTGVADLSQTGALAGDTLCTTKVAVEDNVVITNKGTIEIAGRLNGGGAGKNFSGQTAGAHAKILMGSNAKIICANGSSLLCYGFLYEDSKNNGSEVVMERGSLIIQPFIVRDHRGGSYMYGTYQDMGTGSSDKAASPYSRFHFANVSSLLTMKYGAVMKAWANLYAGDQQNVTTVTMIDTTSAAVIQLDNEDYSSVIAKYDPDTQVCDLKLIGGATVNSMALTLKLGIIGTNTIDTKDCFFPITCYFHITLDNAEGQETATFTMQQRFKLMPGAKLTIEEGAIANIKSLMIYESFTDSHANGKYPIYNEPYPATSDKAVYPSGFVGTPINPALVTVKGQLNCTVLGGKVYTTDTSKVTLTTAYCTTYEPMTVSGSSITAKIAEYHMISAPAILVIGDQAYAYNAGWHKTNLETVPSIQINNDTGSALNSFSVSYTVTVGSDGNATITTTIVAKAKVSSSSVTVSVSGTGDYTYTVANTTSGSWIKSYYSEATITLTGKVYLILTAA